MLNELHQNSITWRMVKQNLGNLTELEKEIGDRYIGVNGFNVSSSLNFDFNGD